MTRTEARTADRVILWLLAGALAIIAAMLVEIDSTVFWPWLWPWVFAAAAMGVGRFAAQWTRTAPHVKPLSGTLATVAFSSRAMGLTIDMISSGNITPTSVIAATAWSLLAAFTVYAWVHLLPCVEAAQLEAARTPRTT